MEIVGPFIPTAPPVADGFDPDAPCGREESANE